MRIAAIAISLAFAAAAWAQDTTLPAPASELPASEPAAQPAAATPAAAAPRQVRYVNEDGETLICKPVSGATGTRLKGRGKVVCGTQTQWDDAESEINRMFDTMIRSNTPRYKG